MPTIARYGEWKTPITLGMLTDKTRGIHDVMLSKGLAHWLEDRADQDGITAFVREGDSGHHTLTPPKFCSRVKLCGYQARPLTLCRGGAFISSKFDKESPHHDHRLYWARGGMGALPITPAGGAMYGQLVDDPTHNRVIAVRESGESGCAHEIVGVDYTGREGVHTIVNDHHFAFWPEVSPNGKWLAYITWSKGVMAWDETVLWVAPLLERGKIGTPIKVAGESGESVIQARWSPDGVLHYMSNRTGWWNLYRWQDGRQKYLLNIDADCTGVPWPMMSASYGFASSGRILLKYVRDARWRLMDFRPAANSKNIVDLPYTIIGSMAVDEHQAIFTANSPTCLTELVRLDLKTLKTSVIERSSDVEIDPGYFPEPIHFAYPRRGGGTGYGIWSGPRNKDYCAPEGEAVPTAVEIHGGPHAADSIGSSLHVAAITSRGYGLLQPNFRGSAPGYGREYQRSLYGNWCDPDGGDVADMADMIEYANGRGWSDPQRIVAMGTSGGGCSALLLAAHYPQLLCGAISTCGVTDLAKLHQYGGKLEALYVNQLTPSSLWEQRSPKNLAHKIQCDLLIFQGREDVVVPIGQAHAMAAALQGNGRRYALRIYTEGWHGWHKKEHHDDEAALTQAYFAHVFGVHPPEDLPEIPWGESEI